MGILKLNLIMLENRLASENALKNLSFDVCDLKSHMDFSIISEKSNIKDFNDYIHEVWSKSANPNVSIEKKELFLFDTFIELIGKYRENQVLTEKSFNFAYNLIFCFLKNCLNFENDPNDFKEIILNLRNEKPLKQSSKSSSSKKQGEQLEDNFGPIANITIKYMNDILFTQHFEFLKCAFNFKNTFTRQFAAKSNAGKNDFAHRIPEKCYKISETMLNSNSESKVDKGKIVENFSNETHKHGRYISALRKPELKEMVESIYEEVFEFSEKNDAELIKLDEIDYIYEMHDFLCEK